MSQFNFEWIYSHKSLDKEFFRLKPGLFTVFAGIPYEQNVDKRKVEMKGNRHIKNTRATKRIRFWKLCTGICFGCRYRGVRNYSLIDVENQFKVRKLKALMFLNGFRCYGVRLKAHFSKIESAQI